MPFGIPYTGDNSGVVNIEGGDIPLPTWKTVLGTTFAPSSTKVHYGTSAGNPLILLGGSLSFSCSFSIEENVNGNARQLIAAIIARILAGEDSLIPSYVNVLSVSNSFIHDIDLSIQNFEKYNEGSGVTKLIVGAVKSTSGTYRNPVGHFIVDKAKVTFGIERDLAYAAADESETQLIRLVINKIEDVSTVTVVKKKFL